MNALPSMKHTPWRVEGCGNPAHGPEWKCHHVVDATGARLLSGLSWDAAERYAALPDVVAYNLALTKLIQDARMRAKHQDHGGFWVSGAEADALLAGPQPTTNLLQRLARLEALALALSQAGCARWRVGACGECDPCLARMALEG